MHQEGPAQGIARGTAEFGRVANFSDAIFAIAMTLLVLQIDVSGLPRDGGSARDMLEALKDALPEIVSFGVSFYVIGRYWLAHHWFYSQLARIDRRLLSQNLVYLGFVAFLPFPTALIGEYEENPIAFIAFALSMAAVSLMELVIAGHAFRSGLLRTGAPPGAWEAGRTASLLPVVVFVLSIPIAFVNTTAALLSWLVIAPVGYLANVRMPADIQDYFGKY
ncbi:MAG: TMEM175 family protein [Gaiellaceae bacterium]